MRDTTEAARVLAAADDAWLSEVVKHDPDMIRDVAAALIHARAPKPVRRHHADCELRGDGPCYCEQGREEAYYS